MLKPALFALSTLLWISACSKAPDPEAFLAPLAELAQGAVTEAEARVSKAHALLQGDVAALPKVAAVLAGKSQPEGGEVDWSDSPFIAVGVHQADGTVLARFPRAADSFAALLEDAARGPERGNLTIIPNTFSFTVGLRHAPADANGRLLSALIDVDGVLMDGVIKPTAEAAGGIAFLANRDRRVILSNHPGMRGGALEKWSIPVPKPGATAVGEATVTGKQYHVATATGVGENGWIIGVLVAKQ